MQGRAADRFAAAVGAGAGAPLSSRARPRVVVIAAPGSAGLLAGALGDLGSASVEVPVVRCAGVLPSFVDADTLVVGLHRLGADRGDGLLDEAAAAGATVARIGPSGGPHDARPVAAGLRVELGDPEELRLTSLLGATLGLCAACGLVRDLEAEVAPAASQLAAREAAGADGDELARAIGRTFPLAWGIEGFGAAAASALRAEVQLRAKSPAVSASLPEASYVDVAGFGQSGDITRQLYSLVRLHHDFEPAALAERAAAAEEVVRETLAQVLDLRASGPSRLAQCCDLLSSVEHVARALAAREGVDADAVPVLDDIDRALAAGSARPVDVRPAS